VHWDEDDANDADDHVPGEQERHTFELDAPTVVEYSPIPQAMQVWDDVDDVTLDHVPALQVLHIPFAAYVPGVGPAMQQESMRNYIYIQENEKIRKYLKLTMRLFKIIN